ncbi:MAG: hypothetical protein IJT54_05995 [Candidatus Methanomethylophilaceae archaeon]|nr:hypothetical protein [Candidatus Methanomethylophilaceae archaeon]
MAMRRAAKEDAEAPVNESVKMEKELRTAQILVKMTPTLRRKCEALAVIRHTKLSSLIADVMEEEVRKNEAQIRRFEDAMKD